MCTRTNSATSTHIPANTHAGTHHRGHTQTSTFTRVQSHARPTARSPRGASGARERARARVASWARVRMTAPRPGPRPFPGPRARSSWVLGPGHSPARDEFGCRREDPREGPRAAGRSGGSHTSWRRRGHTLGRSLFRHRLCEPARARSRPSPPRGAPPPALVHAPPRRLGGLLGRSLTVRAPSTLPRPLSLSPGSPPHFKDRETEAQTQTQQPSLPFLGV